MSNSDWISDEMHVLQPDAFVGQEPTAKQVCHVALVALGRNHQWSGDGHDKLVKIGFPVWGIRDMWSGKWLGLWTVPDNRLKVTIAYLYLSLVAKLGGMLILQSFLVTYLIWGTLQVYLFSLTQTVVARPWRCTDLQMHSGTLSHALVNKYSQS
jgi:hypothetical protein